MTVPYLNNLREQYQKPPALTAGLMIFLTLIYFLSCLFPLDSVLKLHASSLKKLDLNRLSFYPIVHLDPLHLVLNLFALYPLLRGFELTNGTVRMGIVLNLFAVLPGVAYCITMMVLFPFVDTSVEGASGWFFALLAFLTLRESKRQPTLQLYDQFAIPTWSAPLVPLVITFILSPRSSFFGHSYGILAGWALEQGYLAKLVEPSTNAVEWIEKKLERVIAMIPFGLVFIDEVRARELRDQSPAPLPTTNEPPPAPAQTGAFHGEGHQLGSV